METVDLTSWEEFEERVAELNRKRSDRLRAQRERDAGLYISEYLFRGQSNCEWGLQTTLERYAGRLLTFADYYRTVWATKPQVETFTGAEWKIPSYSQYVQELDKSGLIPLGPFPAYEYFAYLRHNGFPSPLLDWTLSPYVAAYFAFRGIARPANTSASIYAYCEWTAGHKSGSSSNPEIHGLGRYVRSHRRHFQQQCKYTVCSISRGATLSYARHDEAFAGNKEDQDELSKFNIPISERPKVLARLDQYNINAFSLFGSEESLMETLALREIFLRGNRSGKGARLN
jgi:hypothetical protein